MIKLLIQAYAGLLTSIAVVALCCFVLGVYVILRLFATPANTRKQILTEPMAQPVTVANAKTKSLTAKQLLQDLTAIAGEDILLTQLDLAQAYIDSGKKDLAKNILNNVLAQGSAAYKQEAKQLLNCI